MHWHFTVKKTNMKKTHADNLITFDPYRHCKKIISKICLIKILRIEFIDTETITMYEKLHCERHRYIFYGILKLEVIVNIISILLLHMDERLYKQPDFKEMMLLNHFINMCK